MTTHATVCVGDVSINDAGCNEIEILDNESGQGLIAKPAEVLAALRAFMRLREELPLVKTGQGEYERCYSCEQVIDIKKEVSQ